MFDNQTLELNRQWEENDKEYEKRRRDVRVAVRNNQEIQVYINIKKIERRKI